MIQTAEMVRTGLLPMFGVRFDGEVLDGGGGAVVILGFTDASYSDGAGEFLAQQFATVGVGPREHGFRYARAATDAGYVHVRLFDVDDVSLGGDEFAGVFLAVELGDRYLDVGGEEFLRVE